MPSARRSDRDRANTGARGARIGSLSEAPSVRYRPPRGRSTGAARSRCRPSGPTHAHARPAPRAQSL